MARQGPRWNDSRSRSRNRGRPAHRRDRSASRQPPTHRRQEPLELPRTWRSSPTEYDTNREYGLNLPRQVVSNKFTRDLQIDGMDIFDIRLAQVMTGGLTNWGLRSLANGRHTVWESFKSRQEAITAGTLMRALRGENSTHYSGADLNSTLTHMTKNMFPGQDPYLWDNRYTAIKELAKELAKVVAQKGPSAANQSMLQQIQELQRENARLKSGKAQASRSVIPASPAHTPPPKGARTPKGSAAVGLTPHTSQGSQASGGHPTPPSYRRPKDRQSSTEATEGPVRSLDDSWNARPADAVPEDFELN